MSEDTRHVIVEDEALAAGFTQIPNLVLRRSDLQPGAKLTYMVLLSYAWQEDHAYPGQDRLAADMGVSERSVITYLKQLQETGLITIRRRGLGMTNVYVLHRLTPRSEKSASPEVQEPTALEVQDFRPKKTQRKNTQRDKFEHSKGTRLVEKYDEAVITPPGWAWHLQDMLPGCRLLGPGRGACRGSSPVGTSWTGSPWKRRLTHEGEASHERHASPGLRANCGPFRRTGPCDAGADRARAACLSASFTDDRGGASLVLARAAGGSSRSTPRTSMRPSPPTSPWSKPP